MQKMITIGQMKQLNALKGQYFFTKGAMKFFNSKVESQGHIISGYAYFITSEQFNEHTTRGYSIRTINLDNGEVETVGAFNIWASKKYAMEQIRSYIKSINKVNTRLGENNTCNL